MPYKEPVISNVNKGVCQRRAQEPGAAAFFVNWQADGKNQYSFHFLAYSMYREYERLKGLEVKKPRL